MPNLLIELGTEELPVDGLQVIYSELAAKTKEVFKKNHLSFQGIQVGATPRRIALFLASVGAQQEDQVLELSGPSYEKAYDAEGQPTPALNGFLKSKNLNLKDVILKVTPKGKFVVGRKKEKGRPAHSILPALLKEIFTSLHFPKTMRWEPSGLRFSRPLRWIVALLDKKIISLPLAGVPSGRATYGHRFLAPKSLSLPRADWSLYKKLLQRAHVVLDLETRKSLIRKALKSRFAQNSFDEELLHTTAQLVEEPFLIRGSFSKNYLKLPAEVLTSCMKKNQKIFACRDAKNHLTGHFAAVLNGKRKGLGRIQADYENVLESRLRDAGYFYEADTKEPLAKKVPLLGQIIYLGKLGTMLDKTARLEKLAETFAALIGRNDLKDDLKRSATLAKADLMTQLVYEFPDLQGIVGREYALEAGEKEEVAKAIGTQYLPKNLAEDYREITKQFTPLGAFFGVMDRLDLLVGAFGMGLEPTGSQDPFALRRAGGCVVKIIRAFRVHFSLAEVIEKNTALYGASLDKKTNLTARLKKFLEERIVFEIQAKPGSRAYEILLAVLRSASDDLADVLDRYDVLARLYEHEPENFLKAAKVVERTGNILKGMKEDKGKDINPELFQEALERELFQLCEGRSREITESLTKRDYKQATLTFGKVFYDPLHQFFDKVMVNVEDPAIRGNRQALMKRINRLYTERLADLSMLSRLDQG